MWIKRPMNEAPKDGTPILVWHDHKSDPYFLDNGNLTEYGCYCEPFGFVDEPGFYIAVYGGGYTDGSYEEGYYYMPDWWFAHDSDEKPLAPIYWYELPKE